MSHTSVAHGTEQHFGHIPIKLVAMHLQKNFRFAQGAKIGIICKFTISRVIEEAKQSV